MIFLLAIQSLIHLTIDQMVVLVSVARHYVVLRSVHGFAAQLAKAVDLLCAPPVALSRTLLDSVLNI